MADNTHNILPEILVTKQNLIDEGFVIDKKFVMIDSRAYTPEAFEYVCKLADLVGSLVFVYDTKKIWANGRYFGGDVFQDDLHYFTEIASTDWRGFTGVLQAHHPKDFLTINGKGHVEVTANYNSETGQNTLDIDYNLKNAVNTSRVEINGSKYNLVVENGQIKFNEYKPVKVTFGTIPALEYDSGDTSISVKLYITGSLPNGIDLKLNVETEDGNPVVVSDIDKETNTFTAEIPNNTNVRFTVFYDDGETSGTVITWQKWGYKISFGVFNPYMHISIGVFDTGLTFNYLYNYYKDNFELFNEIIWVPGTKLNFTFNTEQNVNEYILMFAPDVLDFEFTDTSINLTGGWTPWYQKSGEVYESPYKTDYIVWRTDNSGLGLINWKVKGEAI